MVKKNYQAWHVNAADFSENLSDIEKLEFFARYAILAPSGHNTQPWHFERSDKTLLLKNNPSRHLPYSGTQAAEPYISLGTCLETFSVAAEGFGYKLSIQYLLQGNAVASITLGDRTVADPALLQAILHRVSNRHAYETESLPKTLVKELVEHSFQDVEVFSISKKVDIQFVAEQTKHATHTIMGDPLFRLELSKWVRNNLTRKHDGMPGHVQGIPTPPSMVAKHVIKNIDVSKDQAKKDASRVIQSADLVLIMIKRSSNDAFMNAGRLYAQVCIRAEQHGIASSGIGAAVVDLDTKKAIMNYFKLSLEPVAIIRLGKTDKRARHTPRWSLEKVID